jgi:outer membrane protein
MFKALLSGLLITAVFIAKANAGGYAYVDFQLAGDTVKDGVTAKAKLEKEFKEKQKLLQNREAEIKKMMADYQKKQLVMTPEKRAQEEQTIQKKMMEARDLEQQAQAGMQKRQMDLLQPIQEKMISIVQEIAEKEGYELIFAKNSAVLYAKDAKDLTSDLIDKYDATSGEPGKKKEKKKS